jgi:hypothetical protein
MFAVDSIDDVLLGVPTISNERVSSCYNSKIGGAPLWISETNTHDRAPTICSHCKKPMLFALQIYAPMDDVERALYVFCCPSSCATQSYGWKVLKDQRPKGKATLKGNCSDKQGNLATETPRSESLKTDWLGLCAPPPALQSSKRTDHCDADVSCMFLSSDLRYTALYNAIFMYTIL